MPHRPFDTPKVDIHVHWTTHASSLLSVLLVPFAAGDRSLVMNFQSSHDGFSAAMQNGDRLFLRASYGLSHTELQVEEDGLVVHAKGRMLLVIQEKHPSESTVASVYGVCLACKALQVNGVPLKRVMHTFEFRLEKGVVEGHPIRMPALFKWVGNDEKESAFPIPSYWKS
mmetsp:Transcript_33975/g.55054  ORF Transcript_33975/g.55054 Transcript_33975/m.55054 type:complete len:170 (+) Transcript_33975:267-776(+)